ncbi:MAG: hypothetical protein ACK4NC_03485 [Candidatus Gracilibacteria bacterium]
MDIKDTSVETFAFQYEGIVEYVGQRAFIIFGEVAFVCIPAQGYKYKFSFESGGAFIAHPVPLEKDYSYMKAIVFSTLESFEQLIIAEQFGVRPSVIMEKSHFKKLTQQTSMDRLAHSLFRIHSRSQGQALDCAKSLDASIGLSDYQIETQIKEMDEYIRYYAETERDNLLPTPNIYLASFKKYVDNKIASVKNPTHFADSLLKKFSDKEAEAFLHMTNKILFKLHFTQLRDTDIKFFIRRVRLGLSKACDELLAKEYKCSVRTIKVKFQKILKSISHSYDI